MGGEFYGWWGRLEQKVGRLSKSCQIPKWSLAIGYQIWKEILWRITSTYKPWYLDYGGCPNSSLIWKLNTLCESVTRSISYVSIIEYYFILIGYVLKGFKIWRYLKACTIYIYLSIKAPVCQWVSEWVSLCVCLFPNSSKTTKPDELKFWGMIPLGM